MAIFLIKKRIQRIDIFDQLSVIVLIKSQKAIQAQMCGHYG